MKFTQAFEELKAGRTIRDQVTGVKFRLYRGIVEAFHCGRWRKDALLVGDVSADKWSLTAEPVVVGIEPGQCE